VVLNRSGFEPNVRISRIALFLQEPAVCPPGEMIEVRRRQEIEGSMGAGSTASSAVVTLDRSTG
jgi:hypothetical protein